MSKPVLSTDPHKDLVPVQRNKVSKDEDVSPIYRLSLETLLPIFFHLRAKEALEKRTVCKQWDAVLLTPCLWQHFLKRDLNCIIQFADSLNPLANCLEKYRTAFNLSQSIYFEKEKYFSTSLYHLTHCYCYYKDQVFACDSERGCIYVYDFKGENAMKILDDSLKRIPEHAGNMNTLVVSDGKVITGLEGNEKVGPHTAIWDLSSGICEMCIPVRAESAFLNQKELIAHDAKGNIEIYDLASGKRIQTIERPAERTFRCATLSPDGKKLIYAIDKEIEVWNLRHEECEQTLKRPGSPIQCLMMTGGSTLISGSSDFSSDEGNSEGGEICLWNVETGLCEMTLTGHTGDVVAFTLTGMNRLISLSSTGEIKVWDTQSGHCQSTFTLQVDEYFQPDCNSLFFSEQGQLIIKWGSSIPLDQPSFKVFDFNVRRDKVFEQIADVFEECLDISSRNRSANRMSADQRKYVMAMKRFKCMPHDERKEIYNYFSKLIGECYPCTANYPEIIFHDTTSLVYSPKKKAAAIRNLLKLSASVNTSFFAKLPPCRLF